MPNNTRYVVGGGELGRAPMLKKCPLCAGIADYMKLATASPEGKRVFVRCSECGTQTRLYHYPENAGERWNARTSENARVIATQEILEFRASLTDDRGVCACWMETIEGDLWALTIEVRASMDGREVYECGWGDYWPRERVNAEGIRWRLWDRKPTPADREREPWGKVGYKTMSEAARAEAERIRRELDARAAAEAQRRTEADRRHMEALENAAAQAGEL